MAVDGTDGHRTTLDCAVLQSTVEHFTVLYDVELYPLTLYSTLTVSTVLYCTVLYCTVLFKRFCALQYWFCTVPRYCTVLYYLNGSVLYSTGSVLSLNYQSLQKNWTEFCSSLRLRSMFYRVLFFYFFSTFSTLLCPDPLYFVLLDFTLLYLLQFSLCYVTLRCSTLFY